MIIFFAFLALLSSHSVVMYINHPIISDITARSQTYFIHSAIHLTITQCELDVEALTNHPRMFLLSEKVGTQ